MIYFKKNSEGKNNPCSEDLPVPPAVIILYDKKLSMRVGLWCHEVGRAAICFRSVA